MFVTRKYHNTILRLTHESNQASLRQYEKRISDYQAQINDLRRLVFTPSHSEILPVAREADAILSISEKPIDLPDSSMTPEDMREFDAVVSGEHEEAFI